MKGSTFLKFIFITMLIGLICTVNLGFVYAADPWWDSQWSYRKSITVDNTKVAGDLADFPVLVDIIDSDLSSKALSDGDDIVFTDSVANQLSHEIESYDNVTGHLVAWVKAPDLSSSTDTVLYLYYGNSGASNQENASDVWSSNFTMVHHFEETSGTHIDSTFRDNNGTIGGGVNQSAVGIVDGAVELEGVNGYVLVPHSSDISGFNDSFTASVWMRIDNSTYQQQIFAKYNVSLPLRGWYVRYRDWETSIALVASTDGSTNEQWHTIFTPQNGSWHHITIVWETGTVPSFYVNGSQTATEGTATLVDIFDNPGANLYLGRFYTPTFLFDGILDEARISKTARDSAWISTGFNNQDDPQSFYTVGSEETGNVYYITATAGSGGSISPQGSVSVDEGADETFYFTHDDGYEVSDVLVDSFSQGALVYYTFTNVVSNHIIEAQFTVVTPPVISKDKSKYSRGNTVTITVTGGTDSKPVMLQINNPSGGKVWADQDTFAVDGSYVHQFKIPASWSYGVYTIHVRDVEAGTTKSASLNIPSPSPPPPPPPPPPPSPPPSSNKKPVSNAGPDQNALVGRTVYFDGSESKDPDGTISTYLWIFGDGDTSTAISTSHVYLTAGEYSVELIVIDNQAGASSDFANITVQDLPLEPEAGLDEGVGGDETNYLVDSIDETNTAVTLNTTDQVTVSLLQYPDNPYPDEVPENSLPTVVDVFVSNTDGIIWPIYVERHYSDADVEGLDESMLVLYYYSDGAWHICSETGVYPDLNIVWANMIQSEVMGSPTLIAPRPSTAAFEIKDLTITPSTVEPGDIIMISVTVSNIGGDSGNYTVTLTVEGETEDTETVSLDGETSTPVTFNVTKTDDGTYSVDVNGLSGDFIVHTPEPAEFELSGFDLSGTHVQPDEQIEGTVRITNVGEESGSYTLEVELDGTIVDLQVVTLDGGESTTVNFIISSDDEGTHIVQLESQTKSFIVTLPSTPAEIEVSSLSLSKTEVEPEEEIEGSVSIENVGEETGTYTLAASLDGALIHEEVLSLTGGQSTTITFDVSSDEPGSHTVQVEGLSESFTVLEPAAGTNWLLIDLGVIALVIVAIYYARKQEWI